MKEEMIQKQLWMMTLEKKKKKNEKKKYEKKKYENEHLKMILILMMKKYDLKDVDVSSPKN